MVNALIGKKRSPRVYHDILLLVKPNFNGKGGFPQEPAPSLNQFSFSRGLLVGQRTDAGQNLALKQLKRSTTTGGAEGKLVSHLELLSSGYGVATTYDGDAIGLS